MDYDALERLVRLRDQGALSSEEFAEQKRILIEGNGAAAAVPLVAAQRFSAYSLIQKISAAAFIVGLCAVLYSTFVYDTTISPMDSSGTYSSVDEFSSIEDKARAISDVTDRFNRTMAGERIINFPRVEEQRQIFLFGALLMVLGAVGFVVPSVRGAR